jgi:hypothetical protein
MGNHKIIIDAGLVRALGIAGAVKEVAAVAERACLLVMGERAGEPYCPAAPATGAPPQQAETERPARVEAVALTAREALLELAAHGRWNWRDASGLAARGKYEGAPEFTAKIHEGWPINDDVAYLDPLDLGTVRFLAHRLGQAIGAEEAAATLASFLLAAWGES